MVRRHWVSGSYNFIRAGYAIVALSAWGSGRARGISGVAAMSLPPVSASADSVASRMGIWRGPERDDWFSELRPGRQLSATHGYSDRAGGRWFPLEPLSRRCGAKASRRLFIWGGEAVALGWEAVSCAPRRKPGPMRKHLRFASGFWIPAFAGAHISIGSYWSSAVASAAMRTRPRSQ